MLDTLQWIKEKIQAKKLQSCFCWDSLMTLRSSQFLKPCAQVSVGTMQMSTPSHLWNSHPTPGKLRHQERPWSSKVASWTQEARFGPCCQNYGSTPTPLHFMNIFIFVPCTGMIQLSLTFILDEGVSVLFAPTLISEACINLPPRGNHFEHIE